MRLIVLLTSCVFFHLSLFSQHQFLIQGKVISKNGPLEYATIQLFQESDSIKPLSTLHTDSSGKFEINVSHSGNHSLAINMIGFISLKISIARDPQKDSIDLGVLKLEMISKELETIMVSGKKNILEKTSQGFIINASANLTQVGGTLTDLLRNTPTVNVDGDGVLTLRGKAPLILINGRNSSFSNTDRISSASIESIEIINNPSSQYDASAEGGIINIKLKKSKQNGFNSAFVLGSGLGSKGRFNSSLLLNNKSGKWNTGIAYDNRFAGRNRSVVGEREAFNLPDEHFLSQQRNDSRNENLQNYRVNIDFIPNEKNNFGFELLNNHGNELNDEFLISKISDDKMVFKSKSARRSIEKQNEKVIEFALNYNRKFSNPGQSFTAMVSSSLGDEKQHTDITTQSIGELENSIGNPLLQETKYNEKTHVTNIKGDFVQPISKNLELLTGMKSTIRFLNADFQNSIERNGVFQPNPGLSNIFDFNEQIHALYFQFNGLKGIPKDPSLKYDIGFRAEQVSNSGHGLDFSNQFRNNYLKLFPSAGLSLSRGKNAFWKASYSRRITRPGLGQLNPFIDITDSLNQHGGNPNLKPEMVHSIDFGYSKDWQDYSLYTIVYFRSSSNAIRQFTTISPNGVALTIPINFGNVNSYGIENIATAKLGNRYDFNLSLSLFQQDYIGKDVSKGNTNKVFSWNGKWIQNIVPWKGGKLQLSGIYNSPLATPQGRRLAVYYADLGFQQKTRKGKGRFGMVITDVFNTQINGYLLKTSALTLTRKSKIDTRAILFTFAYSFGGSFKEKLMENKFTND